MPQTLRLLPPSLAVAQFPRESPVPAWATSGDLFCVARTADELSVVCEERLVPAGVRSEGGWRALMLAGPFEFTLTGVLSSVLAPLAEAGVGIFAFSTFDTDYVLVKAENVERAVAALRAAGHTVDTATS
ncbi:ACT domain-containing protein [Deinococcus pimensis]|uniref:ACT domain-containing protein n=1 Tax=Deinococcus pimensis TaxID=309888 RepID=UPI00047FBA38|nr:ACT domain-containing protein [Deinococcus pimensis]